MIAHHYRTVPAGQLERTLAGQPPGTLQLPLATGCDQALLWIGAQTDTPLDDLQLPRLRSRPEESLELVPGPAPSIRGQPLQTRQAPSSDDRRPVSSS